MSQGGDRIRALPLLRRGLTASPELRQGIAVTLLLALAAGGGRVITPVLVQQAIDHHVNVDRVRVAGMLPLAALGLVLVLVTAWAARTTNQRLARASELTALSRSEPVDRPRLRRCGLLRWVPRRPWWGGSALTLPVSSSPASASAPGSRRRRFTR